MRGGVEIAADVLHARWHDADHRERLTREQQRSANDAGIGLEMSAPEAIAEDDDVIVILEFLFLFEVSAESRVITEDAKIFVADAHGGDVLGTVAEGEVQIAFGV